MTAINKMTISILLVLFGRTCIAGKIFLRPDPPLIFQTADTITEKSDSLTESKDSTYWYIQKNRIDHQNAMNLSEQTTASDSVQLDSIWNLSAEIEKQVPKPRFIPDPKRALWLALVLPGAGQIYNRKYWKLPIIYGGFVGCTYALMWNQQMYKDYSQAYLDIMDDDPNTNSYLDMLPPRYDITGKEDQFKRIFKNKKDYYRKYRDLSIFCFVGVYILSVIDAYVDAQLSVFDISRDLSMRVEPAVINQKNGLTPNSALGLQCSFNF